MAADLARAKQRMRRELSRLRSAVTAESAARAAQAVLGHLARCADFSDASCVALYAALPGEVPTRPCFELLRERGAETLFPRIETDGLAFCSVARWEDLEPGRYGVLEPPRAAALRRLEEADLVLVPGLAFDAQGNRLGQGKGYYDAALPALGVGPPIVGMAHAFQVLAQVPHGSRDRRVDAIVTENGMQWCTP